MRTAIGMNLILVAMVQSILKKGILHLIIIIMLSCIVKVFINPVTHLSNNLLKINCLLDLPYDLIAFVEHIIYFG